jgi:hypothetical protein
MFKCSNKRALNHGGTKIDRKMEDRKIFFCPSFFCQFFCSCGLHRGEATEADPKRSAAKRQTRAPFFVCFGVVQVILRSQRHSRRLESGGRSPPPSPQQQKKRWRAAPRSNRQGCPFYVCVLCGMFDFAKKTINLLSILAKCFKI